MIRYAMCTVLLLAPALSHALPQQIDPRDPTIWQVKTEPASKDDDPCHVFSNVVCPAYEDEKSDLQRQKERREQRRLQTQYEKYH